MRCNVNKSSLERGSLDAAMISSTGVHAPKKGVNDVGQKASTVVQAPGKVFKEEILEALRVML